MYTHNDTKYYSIIAYRHVSELIIYAILKLYFGYIIVYMYIIIHINVHTMYGHKILILDVVKRNPLFLHEIEWKNNGFLFVDYYT